MKSKNNKLKIIFICFSIVLFLAILIFFGCIILGDNKNPYGDRCDEKINYAIDDKQIKKIKNKFKEVEEVKNVDVYTKLCTIKILIDLKSDVDLEIMKTKAKEIFEIFSEDEMTLYDFALYISSDNKESEVYPINVSKHSSREDFSW